jgi:DNA mismatch repair protein MutL
LWLASRRYARRARDEFASIVVLRSRAVEPARGRTIRLLPPEVANQIAAGEVVERPASVVKELVENGLDAGARSIAVSIDEGGVARIAVTDDGSGMSPDDLSLAVVRHATSKIRHADDLVGVATYGFRGEALPSIASVSKLRIATRLQGSDEGAEILVEGGGEARVRPVGCAIGTTVSVDSLFYNTPARRKFLRTPGTESAACLDAIVKLALPRPEVKFVVRRDGKVVRELLRQSTVAARAREVFADEALAEMRGERGGLSVLAMLGPPERARSGTHSLALFVNGRNVRDRVLLRAVAQAYGSTLAGGRYPVGALFLDVPPGEVDVNVHPQKAEVRFAAQNQIFAAIASVVREHLGGAPWARATASGSVAEVGLGRFEGGPIRDPAPPQTLFRRIRRPRTSASRCHPSIRQPRRRAKKGCCRKVRSVRFGTSRSFVGCFWCARGRTAW